MPNKPLHERFWSAIEKQPNDGCWLWRNLSTNGYGYGQIWNDETTKLLLGHRISWELHHGSIPKGLFVLHKCDVPACVNPAHLFLGTQRENLEDMRRKQRGYEFQPRTGQANNKAKLTEDDVKLIRTLFDAGGHSLSALGRRFGVFKQTIRQVVLRKTWKHVQ
jgi:hypothetical protein